MVDRTQYVNVGLIKKLIHKRQKIETHLKSQIASTNMVFICIVSIGLLGLIIYYRYQHKQYMDKAEKEAEERRRIEEEARLAAEAEQARKIEVEVHKMATQGLGNQQVRNAVLHEDDREAKVKEVSKWVGSKDQVEDGASGKGKRGKISADGYKTIQSILADEG